MIPRRVNRNWKNVGDGTAIPFLPPAQSDSLIQQQLIFTFFISELMSCFPPQPIKHGFSLQFDQVQLEKYEFRRNDLGGSSDRCLEDLHPVCLQVNGLGSSLSLRSSRFAHNCEWTRRAIKTAWFLWSRPHHITFPRVIQQHPRKIFLSVLLQPHQQIFLPQY